ncbi:MAG: hypothetical protein MJA30_36040 [Cytophagales bacterium]|nr:hypothetical protein [Cytophagales bacterium]
MAILYSMEFHSEEFIHNRVRIPGFTLSAGSLIRIYIPNFDRANRTLGMGLAFELIAHFQNKWPRLKWAKNYSQPRLPALIWPITVARYLRHIMQLDVQSAGGIAKKLQVSLKDKFESLDFKTRKALTILAAYQNHDTILFDYYGIDALSIEFLENLVNDEIETGKSAIAFDNLQYAPGKEPFENIVPIKISIDLLEES